VTWTLHLGDCLDPVSGIASLAYKSVDVVITDPPYEAEAHEKGKRQGPGYTGTDYARGVTSKPSQRVVDESFSFAPITEGQRSAVALQIARVSRVRAAVFCQVEAVDAWKRALESAGMLYRRTIPWVKPDAMPSLHGRWPGQSFESIVLAQHRSVAPCPVGGKARYYEHTRERLGRDERPHPTVKPTALMMQIVEDFTDPGDLILDPFAGSGTTGVAALMLGRRFIGWERDPDYHAIATRRLNGDEAKPRAEQPSLFPIGGAA
jgi:DNA modification methylase